MTTQNTIKAEGFATYQEGTVIYGIGLKREEAIEDALDSGADVSSLITKPATWDLMAQVNAGKVDSWEEVNGVLCTEAEAENAR